MAQLRLSYSKIQQKDAEILQVTWSTLQEAQLYFQQYSLAFPYLCDPELEVYKLYSLSELKGTARVTEAVKSFVASPLAEISDRLLRGEKSPSPLPYIKRYGALEMEQRVYIIDKAGTIRYDYTSGPIGHIPGNEEILSALATL